MVITIGNEPIFSASGRETGLTKREYFAALILATRQADLENDISWEIDAAMAIEGADALIAALNAPQGESND